MSHIKRNEFLTEHNLVTILETLMNMLFDSVAAVDEPVHVQKLDFTCKIHLYRNASHLIVVILQMF